MAEKKPFEFSIEKELGVLQESDGSNWCIELNKISWQGRPPVIDIRRMNQDKEAKVVLGKGVSLTDDGTENLVDLLLEEGFGNIKIMKKILKSKGYKVVLKKDGV